MFRSFAWFAWLCSGLLMAQSGGSAQKPSVVPLVPPPTWRLVSSHSVDLNAVRKWGGDPAIEREYGVKSLEIRTYRWDDKVAEVVFEQALDVSCAYGLLTYYQTETMKPEGGSDLTLTGPDGALMARGRVFIRVLRPVGAEATEGEFRDLLRVTGGTPPSTRARANLPVPLPVKGLIPGSEKYLLGLEAARRVLPSFRSDLIGFSQGAEVQVGAYADGKARLTLLAITYPTPQIARTRYGAMEKLLEINQDRGLGSIYGRRQGSFVFLVLNSDSAAHAGNLLDEFKVTGHISWDERYPGVQPLTLQLLKLILANLLLVLIVAGLAVAAGVLIVLSRRVAAKWFPHSSWGHPDEGTIIRLNLSYK